MDIDAKIKISQGRVNHPNSFLPMITMEKPEIYMDFEYKLINPTFMVDMIAMFKKRIKKVIIAEIKNKIQEIVNDFLSHFFKKFMMPINVYFDLSDDNVLINYSLKQKPYVNNGYIVLEAKGDVINLNKKQK